jgi:hypothetical protein
MNILILPFILAASCYPVRSLTGSVQTENWPPPLAYTQPPRDQGLFTEEKVLDIKLSGKIRDLMNDRSETPAYHNIQLSYRDADSNEVSISLQAKARGHFRKTMANCTYPPLLLHFSKKDTPSNSLFSGQEKIKLVMPCQGDEYVIREWLLYKIYNLVTGKSFRTRLVRIELNDEQKKKKTNPFYGFLLEDEGQMAKRNQMMVVEKQLLRMEQTEINTFLRMAVFQYLIGNTDWSVQYQQNIKLLVSNSQGMPYTVPYDFDHAGMVNAPYALPAEELQMRSVRERRYRGFCITDMSQFKETLALFNRLKEPIYQLYTSCSFLDAKYIKSATQYLDEFYNTINNEKKMKAEFSYPCDKNGTGNIIIRGLKKE